LLQALQLLHHAGVAAHAATHSRGLALASTH
jgi:hypothetical protein